MNQIEIHQIKSVLLYNLRQTASPTNNKTINIETEEQQQQHYQQQSKQPKQKFQLKKMEGDFPRLNLQKSFFVEGVRIGWPYPCIMPPQRQMAIHLIKALKNKRHVVLESPTGTG